MIKVNSHIFGSGTKTKSKKKISNDATDYFQSSKMNNHLLDLSQDSLGAGSETVSYLLMIVINIIKMKRISHHKWNHRDDILKKLVHLKINPLYINKQEFDLLRLPEMRGLQINIDDLGKGFEIYSHFNIFEIKAI